MTPVAALSVAAVTVGLSLGQPRLGRIRIHHSGAAVIGATLTILLGIAPPDVLAVAARTLAGPIATIVSLMVVTQVADRSGLFALVGTWLARSAGGSGPRLFRYVFLAGAMAGMVFTNDAAVLIFTPIVFDLVERAGGTAWTPQHKLPFYFAVLYVANLVGALVIANPINLVVANLLHIGFLEFAAWMTVPALVSTAVSFAGIWLVFRRQIPGTFVMAGTDLAPRRAGRSAIASAALVSLTLLGFFTEPLTGLPPWLVAVTAAAAALLLHRTLNRQPAGPVVVNGVGWDVIIFMAGMFIVGLGLRHVGATHVLGSVLNQAAGGSLAVMRGTIGLLAGLCSAVINNHPTADLMAFTIQDLSVPQSDKTLLAFAALIGGDLGPKMLPIGSLAALIWFRLLRERGVDVPYSLYIRIGVPVTLAALVAALAALELQVHLLALLAPWRESVGPL